MRHGSPLPGPMVRADGVTGRVGRELATVDKDARTVGQWAISITTWLALAIAVASMACTDTVSAIDNADETDGAT